MSERWTTDELNEFDRVTWRLSSRDQVVRISAGFEIKTLIEKHGKAKCDAMFEHLTGHKNESRRLDCKTL